jgi:general stress protein YciG
MVDPEPPYKPRPRGFAAMTPDQQKEIASKGGKAAHASGRAHQFTPDEARAAAGKRRKRSGPAK